MSERRRKVAVPGRAAHLVVDDIDVPPALGRFQDRLHEVPLTAEHPGRPHDEMPASTSNLGLSGQLRATVGVKRRGTILLRILLGLGPIEYVVGRDVDDPCPRFLGGLGDVPRSERVHGVSSLRISLAPVHIGHGREVDDDVDTPRGLVDGAGDHHVELTMWEEPSGRKLSSKGLANLASRPRHENCGIRSHWSSGLSRSRAERIGRSIPHGIASEGSFQAMPNSSVPSYSSLTR